MDIRYAFFISIVKAPLDVKPAPVNILSCLVDGSCRSKAKREVVELLSQTISEGAIYERHSQRKPFIYTLMV